MYHIWVFTAHHLVYAQDGTPPRTDDQRSHRCQHKERQVSNSHGTPGLRWDLTFCNQFLHPGTFTYSASVSAARADSRPIDRVPQPHWHHGLVTSSPRTWPHYSTSISISISLSPFPRALASPWVGYLASRRAVRSSVLALPCDHPTALAAAPNQHRCSENFSVRRFAHFLGY